MHSLMKPKHFIVHDKFLKLLPFLKPYWGTTIARCPLFLIIMAICWSASTNPLVAHENMLDIGKRCRLSGTISIPLNEPISLNFKTKEAILTLRQSQVERYRQLISTGYVPSEKVFGAIEDNRPWWGLYGQYVYRAGNKSIEGPSEEARFILNPFLLVAADPVNIGLWNSNRLSLADLASADFPFYWKPQHLVFHPHSAQAEVTYDVSKYQGNLLRWRHALKVRANVTDFSLIAYNARDFNLNYLCLCLEKSTNIINTFPAATPIEIPHMIHCGTSCGYPGGCNNMSPMVPEIDQIRITGLPARACIYLWHDQPRSAKSPPDMTFIINFK